VQAALAGFLRRRFGAEEAARVEARWRANFGIPATACAPLPAPQRRDEYDDLLRLLLEHAAGDAEEVKVAARWIAFSSTGAKHLWEDLGLPERRALTQLISECFPGLYAMNTRNMRWKKFFYRQLCQRAEIFMCRSPTCEACSEFPVCFPADSTPQEATSHPS
jgi:nitrogen fixation protein NifQ